MKRWLIRYLPLLAVIAWSVWEALYMLIMSDIMMDGARIMTNPALRTAAIVQSSVAKAIACVIVLAVVAGTMFGRIWRQLDAYGERIRALEEELQRPAASPPIAPPPPPKDAITART